MLPRQREDQKLLDDEQAGGPHAGVMNGFLLAIPNVPVVALPCFEFVQAPRKMGRLY
jgi:hypothetical protein